VDDDQLAQQFEEHRDRLVSVARRVLGSDGGAEDAVQEAWVRLSRAEADDVAPGERLTTVVAQVCLDILRTRTARPEQPARADVLDTLAPAERLAFVLHDGCAVPVDEVGRILGRTPTAAGQLAGRARRRVQSPERTLEADRTVQGRVVDAFLTATRAGDLEELVWLLHPDAELHADEAAVGSGASSLVRGAAAVAETFAGRARATRPALLDGFAAAVESVGGPPRVVYAFTVVDGRIAEIELLADPAVLPRLDLVLGSEAP
jgi:DNA-directed RNA polymerase specialized sigma24 family protein